MGAPPPEPAPWSRGALLAALLGPWLVLWPLPLLALRGLRGQPTALLTHPGGEAVRHVWTWWAAAREGAWTAAHTGLLNGAGGLDLHVVDPLHGAVYQLGAALGGPAVGWALVCALGMSVLGLAGAALARESGAPQHGQWVGVAAGLACGTALASVVDGISEGLGVGWVGLQLAVLLSLRRDPSRPRVALLGGLIAAAAWSGPYNAVWVAMIDVPVGLWLLRRTRRHVVGGVLGLGLSAPVLAAAMAIGADRPGGGGARSLPEPPPPGAEPWRGAWMGGADLLDLLVPAPWTGFSPWATTAYLGVALTAAAAVGLWRSRRWAWAAGAAAFALLALGPFLVVGGEVVGAWTPAALLERLPPFGRLTRWYRAGAVAVLLLAPLAAWACRGRGAALALAALVLLDGRLLAPIPTALPLAPIPQRTALTGLAGPMAEQPPSFPLRQRGVTADLNLLLQMLHQQPTSGSVDAGAARAAVGPGMQRLQRALALPVGDEGARMATEAAALLRAEGYAWVVVYPDAVRGGGEPNVAAALGAPVAEDGLVRVYALE